MNKFNIRFCKTISSSWNFLDLDIVDTTNNSILYAAAYSLENFSMGGLSSKLVLGKGLLYIIARKE